MRFRDLVEAVLSIEEEVKPTQVTIYHDRPAWELHPGVRKEVLRHAKIYGGIPSETTRPHLRGVTSGDAIATIDFPSREHARAFHSMMRSKGLKVHHWND